MKEFMKDLLEGAKAVSKLKQSYHLYLVSLLRRGDTDNMTIKEVHMTATGVEGEIVIKTPDDGSVQVYDFFIKKQDWMIVQDDGHAVIDERGLILYFDTKKEAREAAEEFRFKAYTLRKRRD